MTAANAAPTALSFTTMKHQEKADLIARLAVKVINLRHSPM